MQSKHNVKCSFCDRMVNTVLSAVICPECEAKFLTENCPGCGQPVKSGSITKEHSRLWHSACYSIFELDENDEDIKDYDSTVKSSTKISRKILTGNSTYLFYDRERKLKGAGRYMQRLDSIGGNRKNSDETHNSRNTESNTNGEDDDFGYLSPLNEETEDESFRSPYLLTTYRQIVYLLQSFGFIKERTVDGKIYQDSITGHEFVSFLLNRKQCETMEKAKEIGQSFVDSQIFIPYSLTDDDGEDSSSRSKDQENSVFEGDSELYYVDFTIFETDEMEESDVSSPVKEHSNIVRMTGCLTTVNKDGKSQQLWYELTAGILRSYEMINGKKKEDGDSRCIEALDTQEFTVVPILKANQPTNCFKLVGTVREITYQAESCEMCEEWISMLRIKD